MKFVYSIILIIALPLLSPTEITAEIPDEMIERDPWEEYFPKGLSKAVSYYKEGRFVRANRAAKEERKGNRRGRNHTPALLLEGISLAKLGKNDESSKTLKQLLTKRRSSSDALYLLAKNYMEGGDYETAETLLKEALWFNRFVIIERTDALLLKALVSARNSDTEEKISLYRSVLGADPEHLEGLLTVGNLSLEQDDKKAAITNLKKAMEAHPENSEAKHGLAKALLYKAHRSFDQKDIEQAEELLESILPEDEEEKFNSEIFTTYINSLHAGEKLEKAGTELAKAKPFQTDPEIALLIKQHAIELEAAK